METQGGRYIYRPDVPISHRRLAVAVILTAVEKQRTMKFGVDEERAAWEGLAATCSSPIRRLIAFLIVGFAVFVTLTTAIVLLYNLFGPRFIAGQGVPVPAWAFYVTLAASFSVAAGGYLIWLVKSMRTYSSFAALLRQGGRDPRRPTLGGLQAYSDEQLLALRSRCEKSGNERTKALLERIFGFHDDDSFALAPLSVLPGTFEMNALRVEWETQLLLREVEPMPEISWWTEARTGLLPRQPDETRRLVYALRYTGDSVRELKRRYGYRTERWHATIPEGRLWDAVRDYESARRIQSTLAHRPRNT